MSYLISADCVARYAICAGVGIKHCAEFKADAGFVVLVIGELGAVANVLWSYWCKIQYVARRRDL